MLISFFADFRRGYKKPKRSTCQFNVNKSLVSGNTLSFVLVAGALSQHGGLLCAAKKSGPITSALGTARIQAANIAKGIVMPAL